MDEELVVPTSVHSFGPLRLALIAVAAVAGGFLLSLALGSSPASAAESAPADDPITGPVTGLVEAAGHTVTETVTTVAHAAPATTVTTPLTTSVDAAVAPTPLAPITGAQPITTVVTPVTQLLDGALATVAAPLAPVLGSIVSLPTGSDPAPSARVATQASTVLVLAATITGVATGLLSLTPGSSPEHGVLTGSSSAASGLAVAMGAGLIVLLVAVRRRVPSDAIPASPVFETDSSPD